MLETLRTDFRDIVHAEVRECSRHFNGSSRAESKGSGFTTVGGEHEAPEVPAPKGRFPRRFKIKQGFEFFLMLDRAILADLNTRDKAIADIAKGENAVHFA